MASKGRSLRRGIAHNKMKDAGHRGVNKPYVVDNRGQKIKGNSYFAENWRKT